MQIVVRIFLFLISFSFVVSSKSMFCAIEFAEKKQKKIKLHHTNKHTHTETHTVHNKFKMCRRISRVLISTLRVQLTVAVTFPIWYLFSFKWKWNEEEGRKEKRKKRSTVTRWQVFQTKYAVWINTESLFLVVVALFVWKLMKHPFTMLMKWEQRNFQNSSFMYEAQPIHILLWWNETHRNCAKKKKRK